MNYEKELEAAKQIAREAGVIVLKYFDGDQGVEIKEDNSPVTKADVEINRLVIERLTQLFPADGIIGEEESTDTYGPGRKWLCDPIDGTAGYVWGTPTAMFSLALVIDGVPVLGVVYDAFLDRLYEGVQGAGSYCNQQRLSVSEKGLKRGCVAVTANVSNLFALKFVPKLLERETFMPILSGAVYKSCLVARGNFEGYIEMRVGPDDMAAMQVILEEAGGKLTGLRGETLDYGKSFRGAIMSNGKVHDELVEIIADDLF